MKLEQTIELLHRSSRRMTELLKLPQDVYFWWFLRRESWIHLRLSIRLWLKTLLRRM